MTKFHNTSLSKDITPPWMQGAKEISGHEMLVVHMNEGELEGLDNLQHGPSIDLETGIREYSSLAHIIEMPEIRQVFQHVADELEQHGKISPDLEKIYKYSKEHSLPYKSIPEEKHNPLKSIEHTGRDGDTKLALIPLNLAFFLIELRHEPSINPTTGLLEFKFKKIFHAPVKFVQSVVRNPIRTAGTIAGTMLGGPMVAGIGNTLGSLASGEKLGKSLKIGAMIGGAAYGVQRIGQAAGLTSQGSKKTRKEEHKVRKKHREEYEREREKMEFNRPWKPLEYKERRINQKYGSESDIERGYGIIREPYYLDEIGAYAKGGLVKSFSKGTLVTGPGKGQDDKIKTSVPDGSYIIDASSTSMLGDGSTKAGSKVLEKFENQIKRKFSKSFSKHIVKEVSTKSSQVPVWLSEGEYKIAPLTVTMLGHGSNKKGADILKKMIIKLREHKISKGDDLPPKAKHPLQYIS